METNSLDQAIDDSVAKAIDTDNSSLPIDSEETETQPEALPEPAKPTAEPEPVAEEAFTKIDPSTLPPKQKAIYDKFAKDYMWATQRIANRYKTQIEEKEKALAELQKGAQPTPQDEPKTEEERFQKMHVQLMEKEWQEDQEQEFLTLDPRLDENKPEYNADNGNTFLVVTQKLLFEAEQWKAEKGSTYRFPYVKRAKEILDEWDKSIEKKAQERLASLTTNAKAEVAQFKKSNPAGTSSSSAPIKGKMNLDDAIEAAMRN